MKKRKSKSQLSAQYLLKITQVFENNNWEIESSQEKNQSLFNRYCQRILEVGENKKRDLLLELTERYLWITQELYLEYLIETLIRLFDSDTRISDDMNIYIMPLIAPEDKGKVKSANMLVYLFNDVKLRHHSKLTKYKFQIVFDVMQIKQELLNDKAILILADDFIGTGSTAEKCILSLNLERETYKNIKILCLVAQKLGIEYLKKYEINILAYIMREKGITDYYTEPELQQKIDLMNQIEEKMSVKKENKFGYGCSEALVTMCRTPNNTFPIFWEEAGNYKCAPFPRF